MNGDGGNEDVCTEMQLELWDLALSMCVWCSQQVDWFNSIKQKLLWNERARQGGNEGTN